MTIKRHVSHIKSNIPDKVPNTEDINHGEIAINYTADKEHLYIKNSSDLIKSISTDDENQEVFATNEHVNNNNELLITVLNDLNDRITALEKKIIN